MLLTFELNISLIKATIKHSRASNPYKIDIQCEVHNLLLTGSLELIITGQTTIRVTKKKLREDIKGKKPKEKQANV